MSDILEIAASLARASAAINRAEAALARLPKASDAWGRPLQCWGCAKPLAREERPGAPRKYCNATCLQHRRRVLKRVARMEEQR